jgi:hypothetical protein
MFDDDDDDDDDFLDEELEVSPFVEWFNDHFFYFPVKYRMSEGFEQEAECFYNMVCSRLLREAKPMLLKLMYQQYPILSTDNRPEILEEIDNIASMKNSTLLAELFTLIIEDRNGEDLRKGFKDFESTTKFYGQPEKPHILKRSFYKRFKWISEQEKEQMYQQNKIEAEEATAWSFNRRKEYFDIFQSILFSSYRNLENLSHDGWIVYAVILREDYETFVHDIDRLTSVVEYQFPIEYLTLPFTEFLDKTTEAFRKKIEQQTANSAPFANSEEGEGVQG